jgi:uncharacterized protein (TIGR03032 family)
MKPARRELEALWARHQAEWRDPAQIASHWEEARTTDPALLHHTVQGRWWEVLAERRITLLVTREYEHLVMALGMTAAGPRITYWRMPHPSGLAVDRARGIVHIASTRNPNQIYGFKPVSGVLPRLDAPAQSISGHPLLPVRSSFYPGCLYLHDLALIKDTLYGNAVGQNAVVRFDRAGDYQRVWWPRCIETRRGPVLGRNHLQLNSIAAGATLYSSYFSASTDRVSARRPGHRNFAVDGRGVIFSGATREPVVRGLTRPHSARLHDDQIWVANSGYGELGVGLEGRFVSVARLPGWTRGLCFHGPVAFVGTSRVIPRFEHYAPGLEEAASACGVHAVDTRSGEILGSLLWPSGNQIFALDWAPSDFTSGFPFSVTQPRNAGRVKQLFYAFEMPREVKSK